MSPRRIDVPASVVGNSASLAKVARRLAEVIERDQAKFTPVLAAFAAALKRARRET